MQDNNTTAGAPTAERYRRIAPVYDWIDRPFERWRYRPLRRLMCSDLQGKVWEAGVGTGNNLPYYPANAEVTGIDLSPDMLARAHHQTTAAPVSLRTGDVTATDLPDNGFDAVVASFTLCVLPPDQRLPALLEMGRVCRPGGEIRLLEYQRSRRPLRRFIMGLWEPWVRWAFGADFDIDIDGLIRSADLEVLESRYLVSDIIRYVRLQATFG